MKDKIQIQIDFIRDCINLANEGNIEYLKAPILNTLKRLEKEII
jgi:hypothetical protein